MAKNVLTDEQKRDAERLKAIYLLKAKSLGLTQEKIAIALGGQNQSVAGNYLNKVTALNLKSALVFSKMLQVDIADFSPTLAGQLPAGEANHGGTDPEKAELFTLWDRMTPAERLKLLKIGSALVGE